jgi:hypothetical protein
MVLQTAEVKKADEKRRHGFVHAKKKHINAG